MKKIVRQLGPVLAESQPLKVFKSNLLLATYAFNQFRFRHPYRSQINPADPLRPD
ncbi:MAG: hypothetical protein LBV77_04650 [Candidatus Adiutrix intracellularis]|nr:hypothetical protein [Candidatus Adiutrix intracellularis]